MHEGLLIINKPLGVTSHDVVDLIRKITGEARVGHAGTLDPLAGGVLVILVGRSATKRQSEFMSQQKEYRASIHLGATSETDDAEGTIKEIPKSKYQIPNEDRIQKALKGFVGKIEQVPPAYSAIKLEGKKAYELARQGQKPNLKARLVVIEDIELLNYSYPLLEISISCSKGTYIRSLARDIGNTLLCGAYLSGLVRTKSGNFSIEGSVDLSTLTSTNWWEYLVNLETLS